MTGGYAFGPVLLLDPVRRKRWLIRLGLLAMLGFIALRMTNGYRNPTPWQAQDSTFATILSFIDNEKYPPSLLYLGMTLGPALIALAALGNANGRIAHILIVIGRVPLLYYVAHLLFIHALAVATAVAMQGDASWLYGGVPFTQKPHNYGYGLAQIYLLSLVVVAALYPPCLWFANLKRRRKNGWLSYF